MTAPRRVAVLGVPRGGTSAVVGLLRILGYRLPGEEFSPECHVGESARLRSISNGGRALISVLRDIYTLPPGTVWKDPTVGSYVDKVDLSGWDVVEVRRPLRDIALSEARWSGQHDDAALRERARTWYEQIDGRMRASAHGRHIVVKWDEARRFPEGALTALAVGLGQPEPPESAQLWARSFIAPSSGYTCPVPGRCSLRHPREVSLPNGGRRQR